jgi:TPR repeat protein
MMLLVTLLITSIFSSPAQGAVQSHGANEELWHHRNLGKAFYENPTTHPQAEEEFAKAVALSQSSRDHVNYGLALLVVGKFDKAIDEFNAAQRLQGQQPGAPKLPHVPFGIGIAYKKKSDTSGSMADKQKAIEAFEAVIRLDPDEPIANYNLGLLYEEVDNNLDRALPRYETASRNSDIPELHFTLARAYRSLNRTEDAARENQTWQKIRAAEAGKQPDPERTEWSLYREIYEPAEPRLSADAPKSALRLKQSVIPGVTVDPATAGFVTLDFDGDGKPDLIVWSSKGVEVIKSGKTPYKGSGLENLKDVVDIAPGDFNNDGLIDLCVLTKTEALLFTNVAGKFRDPASVAKGSYSKAIWLNYDHDDDIDLLLLGETPALLQNAGRSGFVDHTSDFPFVKGQPVDAIVFAADPYNPASDVVVSYRDREAVLYRDNLGGKYRAIPLTNVPAGTRSLIGEDVNHDGLIDLIATTASGPVVILNRDGMLDGRPISLPVSQVLTIADLEGRGIADFVTADGIHRNRGNDSFADPMSAQIPPGVFAAESTLEADGRTQVIVIGKDGRLREISSIGPKQHWLNVSLTGVKNLKLAPGSTVEVKAGGSYQKRIYNGTPLYFGLGDYRTVDTVRIRWPNGLYQNQISETTQKPHNYVEAQRLSGSCPMIFVWNGREYEFITDVLGVAPLGASAGDGQYFPVDNHEYVRIPGESITPIEGMYEIRITEELHEVSYIDKVQLIALDHPKDMEIFTNDKFKSPPFPEYRLFGSRRRTYPISANQLSEPNARHTPATDVLTRVSRRDGIYPDGYRRDFNGVAEKHYLDLDFGSAARSNRAVLILNGWVDWADGSTFLGAAQEKNGDLVLPYLQVKNEKNEWQTVIQDMGIPAGKPKTIAVDLAGLFLTNSREVRIVTNLCVYWDEIFLIEENETQSDEAKFVRTTDIHALAADLHFRGFSKPTIDPERRQPESFNYSQASLSFAWNWTPTPGMYTRYGDVLTLVNDDEPDDRFVIMGSGDELRLRFPTQALPSLPPDWKRDFLLLVVGWAKDGDFNTAFSQTVEPLPFHKMSAYPYPNPEHYPDDKLHADYVTQYNTRAALQLLHPLPIRSALSPIFPGLKERPIK